MARWWDANGWEDIFFKRVPTGWVFRAPGPLIFGPRRHYLVSDSQRADIIALFSNITWSGLAAATVLAAVIGGVLWLGPTLWNSFLLTLLLVSIVSDCLIGGYFWLTLRPLLAGARQTTSERITFGERLRANAAFLSNRKLIAFTMFLTVLFVFAAYLALASGSWKVDDLVMTLGLGLMALYCFAMLNAKRKMSAGPWS
jgi:hypothetical protein